MGRELGVSQASHVVTSREIFERYVQKPENRFADPLRKKPLEEPAGPLATFRREILEPAMAYFYGSAGTGMFRSIRELVAAWAEEATRFEFGVCDKDSPGKPTKVDWRG